MRVAVPAVKRGRGPAHTQIEAWLADAVAAGRLTQGDRLPPERELAGRLGVSRMTVRHALASLERRGLVARHVGRGGGTFVAEPKLELAGLAALSDQLRGLGLAAGARVMSARELAPELVVADALQLTPDTPVYEIVRVRLADGEPVALERTSFPADAFPGLVDGPLEGSLYDLIRARFADVPVRAVERLEAALAGEEEARLLEVTPGAPLLRVERTAYAASGRPLEYSCDLFRGDRTRVVWESAIKGSAA
jgi:GntR family transcriptional regulator